MSLNAIVDDLNIREGTQALNWRTVKDLFGTSPVDLAFFAPDIDFDGTDQLAKFNAALIAAAADGVALSGGGRTISISGNGLLPAGGYDLQDLTIKQLDSNNASRRTLYDAGGSASGSLRRVTINRNGSPSDGSTISDAAGIWITSRTDLLLDQVEVFGNGPGTGIKIVSCNYAKVLLPNVHDMNWALGSDPGTEQIVGIWFISCIGCAIYEPLITSFKGSIAGGPYRAYQTDGMDSSASSGFLMQGGYIASVGEGIDISGDDGNERFVIASVRVKDIDSWGIKISNSASEGTISACVAADCGLGGFVTSGASAPVSNRDANIIFQGCIAFNTGSNGNWSASNVAGFSVLQGAADPTHSSNVHINGCLAIDSGSTMKYGFYNEVSGVGNLADLCFATGYTIAQFNGFSGETGTNGLVRSTSPTLAGIPGIDGKFCLLRDTLTLSNGANNNLNPGRSYNRIIGPTGGFSVTGFTSGTDGQTVELHNTTSQQMTIVNASGGSTIPIDTLQGADVVLRAGTSFATFRYDGAASKFVLKSYN